jgi:membrane peptidoglycan carboxypeptidase
MTLSAAIGQVGQMLTPIQLANYVATIVNGGTRYQPHLLKEVRDYTRENVVYTATPTALDKLQLMESTTAAIKEGMRDVVTDDGTASSYFRNFKMDVGGKTGSAEVGTNESANGVFVSFAPFDDPEIVVVVVGERAGSGGSLAPACIEVYNHYFGLVHEEPTQPATTAATAPRQTQPAVTAPSETSAPPVTDPAEPAQGETSAPAETHTATSVPEDPIPAEDTSLDPSEPVS